MTKQPESADTFESAYSRLESILEEMNSGALSLDGSLKLYTEAEGLIATCTKRLSEAEKKIEILTKDRSGALVLDSNGKPMTEPFNPTPSQTGAAV